MTTTISNQSKEEENKYIERNRFWTEQALNQFGVATNFFFLIGFAFFAFLIEKDITKTILPFDCNLKFSVSNFFFVIALIIALLSIILASLTVLSRLNDLRLTRHVTHVRKKIYKKSNKTLSDKYINIDEYTFFEKICCLYKTIKIRNYFLNDNDLESVEITTEKFEKLRLRNLLLARLSWTTFNWQIITLISSLFVYLLSVLT